MGTDLAEIARRFPAAGRGLREMLMAETPRVRVTVGAFYMDRHEVTNRKFQQFVDANPAWRRDLIEPHLHNGDYLKHWENGRCPEALAQHPVTYVSWHAAAAFAKWRGKRLSTEAEWEAAGRGGLRDAEYPWGNNPPVPERANYGDSRRGGTVPVEQYPPNGIGLYDMAGNVWEYCANEWRPNHAATAADGSRRVIRGGSYGAAALQLRVAFRDSHPVTGAGPHVGFRCAADVAAPPVC